MLRLTEGIRSVNEIGSLKTSLKVKTVEVDVVTATIPQVVGGTMVGAATTGYPTSQNQYQG